MRIGEAARLSGASERSLRYYEDEGLIVPGRCDNGYRDYCRPTIDRVRAVRSLLESGLPVRLIREVLPGVLDARPDDAHLCAELLQEVQDYRDRLAARIAALSERQSALDAFLRRTDPAGRRP